MEEKKNKKLKILIIVGIVLILVTGVTIAYFMSRQTGTPTTTTAKDLAITYTNENKFNITDEIGPIMESDILTSAPKVEFTVTNTGEDNVYLQFDIVDITLNKFKDYDFKWALYQGETKITTGSFIAEEDGEVTLAAGKVLAPSTPTVYSVYVWINETMGDQTSLMGGSFTGTMQVTGYGKDNTLANKILTSGTKYVTVYKSEYVGDECQQCITDSVSQFGHEEPEYCASIGKCTAIDAFEYSELDKTIYTTPTFSSTSTDRGLFVQHGDSTKSNFGFPTYYYRGANETNYVSFGTYKTTDGGNTIGEDITWRIVRINEDGSIRLMIADDVTSSASGNPPYDNTDPYVSDYAGNNVETIVNTWYNNNIGSNSGTTLDNLVQTGNFCNDISGNYNAAKTRITNNNPIFTCPNDGVMINSKAGIITADELVYSGVLYESTVVNNPSYLGHFNYYYTMTPYSNNKIFHIDPSKGALLSTTSDSTMLAHYIVINLKPEVTIKSGNGSSTSPYVIG